MNGWIETFTGRKVDPTTMGPGDVDVRDVAHALSNLCRFGGHTRKFYSVAQHSLLVAQLSGPHFMWGLLHDASEAYLVDIPRPIKHGAALKGYRELESRVQEQVVRAFGLKSFQPEQVAWADQVALAAERRDLMHGAQWGDDTYTRENYAALLAHANQLVPCIRPVPPGQLEHTFLALMS